MKEISSLSLGKETRARIREREREQEKQNKENDYSLRHDCFLSSLGFYNTSLCPYVFISHSTRCYDELK